MPEMPKDAENMRGGKRADAGRKPGSTNKEKKPGKDAFLHIRCFTSEKMKIQELAKTAGLSVSDFILSRALPPDPQESI